MIRRFWTLLLLIVLLVGCDISSSPVSGPQQTTQPIQATPDLTAPEVEIPEGGTLSIRLNDDVQPLQPWAPKSHEQEQMIGLLYRSLVRLDQSLIPQPEVAESWQSDASGRVFTMTLRSDITWHDGRPLTAIDAAWTLNVVQNISPTTTLIRDLQHVITDIQVPTSTTLVLQLREPYAPLLSALTIPILPQHIWGKVPVTQFAEADFWRQPVGSGAFVFENIQPDQVVSFVRNEADPIQVPFLSRVAFVVAPDPTVASDALVREELMVAELPWNTSRSLLDSAASQAVVNVGAYPENGWYFIGFNVRPDHVFADRRLRQALARLVTPELIRDELGLRALPISSDHLPGTWTATAPPEDAMPNLQAARDLLQSAGWLVPEGQTVRESNGLTLTARLYVRADDDRRVRLAERISALAADVGMDIHVVAVDFDTLVRSTLVPPFEFDLALMSWTNSRVRSGDTSYAAYDPDNFALFHSSQIYQGAADTRSGLRNFVGFQNQEFDSLSLAARGLYDPLQRQDLYAQTSAIIAEQQPYLFLWADQVPVIMNKQLRSTQGAINLDTPMWLNGVEYWYFMQ